MERKEAPGAWMVVAALFATWFFVWGGGANTGAVFFTPVLHHFGWTRARLSSGFAASALSAGAFGLLVGWLLDRVDARKVMVAGVAIIAAGYVLITRTTNFPQFFSCNLLLGVGFVACTGIPSSLVLANWFTARRGLAMGIALSGASIGGAVMTPVANWAIGAHGWKFGYLLVAGPMIAVTIPMLIAFVRTRPATPLEPERAATEAPAAPVELPGLEVAEALRTRSMYLITMVQFLFAALFAGLGQHLIAYLIDVGYTATSAAQVLSMLFVFTTFGSLVSGPMADRVNARYAVAVTWAINAIAVFTLLGAAHFSLLIVYAVLVGAVGGAFGVLIPLLMLESLGIRRYGSLMGIAGVLSTLGFAVGPIATGWIHDVTGSYVGALWLAVGLSILCVLMCLACRPLQRVLDERTSREAA
ncbi:MAG TPA: MFS transporter [Candidatus Binataceae bacterium]|nr:MFS transporter [Candidatus Binataceae bacterium]